MALQSSGVIKFSDINVELGNNPTDELSLSDTALRTLFDVPSGTIKISQGYGKSNRVQVTITLSSNQTNYQLTTASVPGYSAGNTDVTLEINSGVYVYSTATTNAGLIVGPFDSGDTVSIVNNGYIIGRGGNGGNSNPVSTFGVTPPAAQAGGPAINLNYPVSITNNSYIAGGGGGGRGGYSAGGGGAGGGTGGTAIIGALSQTGGAGGAPGSAGSNGGNITSGDYRKGSGGGGGRIIPGTGGAGGDGNTAVAMYGRGGQDGGGGGGGIYAGGDGRSYGGGGGGRAGGGAGGAGISGITGRDGTTSAGGRGWGDPYYNGGGGGGPWGGSGGASDSNANSFAGAAGGKAVNLNGHTVTWVATGTRYGAIS